MTFYHNCNKCKYCFNCGVTSCETSLNPIKSIIENGWNVKRCPNCNNILEKYDISNLLNKVNEKDIMLKIKFKKDYIIDVSYDHSPMRKNTWEETKVVELEGRELHQAINEKSKKLNLSFGRRASLTKEERFVEKTFEYKKLFNKNDEFLVKENKINILVGDNGCGKSSLINLLLKENKDKLKTKKVIHVDLEKSNPKISTPNPEKGITYTPQEISNQFMWSAESHGETREGVLKGILTLDFDILILDEPEQGLSLKNQNKYYNELKNLNKTIIIITHSKIFVENSPDVFDVERMKWVNSLEYLKEIY